jgi:NAD(P)-dependent dehydrogenase (short-subunit alcohol dehydrogenase family)
MKDKVAVVTGSSQGIGAGIAELLGEKGYAVVVTYRSNHEKANKVVERIVSKGGEAIAVELDVTSEPSVKACFEAVGSQYGKLHVLVNNAGTDGLTPIEDTTYEKWREIVGPKIEGNFLCTKYALPLLQKCEKSDLIVIMSSLGDVPDIKDVAYSVGTAGAVGFVKVMARALAQYGVRTNGVGPTAVHTTLGYYAESNLTSDEAWDEIAKSNPLGRVATVEDVAQTVLTVIDNPSQFWNGNFIYVTGGDHITTTEA